MLEEKIKSFIQRLDSMKDSISTEEATKTSLIMPFFSMLGYDVFNPTEFIPEFTADVGIKKGEKVDYAIVFNGEPSILIEAKSITEKLEKLCGHGVVAEYETDKNVIGGLVVRMDDILIDGSVETKLKQIKEVIEK